jgi:hypothetical protein
VDQRHAREDRAAGEAARTRSPPSSPDVGELAQPIDLGLVDAGESSRHAIWLGSSRNIGRPSPRIVSPVERARPRNSSGSGFT